MTETNNRIRVLEVQITLRSALQQPATTTKRQPHPHQSDRKGISNATHPHRMRLGVEHPGVLPIGTRDLELGVLVRVDQVRVLEHLGEEEGLLEVGEVAAVGRVDVGDGAVAAADARVLGDVGEAGEGPLGMGNCQYLLVLSSGRKV